MPYPPYDRMAHAVRMAQRQKLIVLGQSLLVSFALFVAVGCSCYSYYPDVVIGYALLPGFRPLYIATFVITYWLLRRANH